MGIEDRDYYQERLRQREQQERQERQQLEHTRTRFAAYDRQPRAAFQAGERSLLGMVLVWLLVLGLAYGGMKFYQRVKPASPIQPGAWSIPRAADGHFYVQGSVNGVQTIFLVDTGASLVTINENLARTAHLYGGVPTTFNTANGPAPGRVLEGVPVSIGSFTVATRVGVGLRMSSGAAESLLGQSFLSRFDVLIQKDRMVLRSR